MPAVTLCVCANKYIAGKERRDEPLRTSAWEADKYITLLVKISRLYGVALSDCRTS